MKLYFDALIGTLLVMLIAGVAAVGLMWLLMTTLHAPHGIEVGAEVLAAIGTAIGAIFFYKMTLKTEKSLRDETYT